MKARRSLICAHPGCKEAVKAYVTHGVCRQHLHQGHCTCRRCGGQERVKEYKAEVTLPPMPWERVDA